MANDKMFEVAVRTKMRFPFKGQISVEDAWDLSLADLDSVFKVLNSQLKQVNEESLLNTKTKEDNELEIKIEIIKYIVKVKLEEQEVKKNEREKREHRQRIMELITVKENEQLQGLKIEELKAMLQESEK